MLSNLTTTEANFVLLAVMDGVRYEGCDLDKDLSNEALFSQHFRGKLASAYKVWAWALEVNYRDFINAARSSPVADLVKVAGLDVLSTMKTSMPLSGESSTTDKVESTSETSIS